MEPRSLFWPLAWLLFYPVFTLTCNMMDQYQNNGRCCDKCPPGSKVESDCTESTATQCTACNNGEYQATWNQEKACHVHHYCDHNAGLIVKTKGSSTADAVCDCEAGRHCSSEECATCVKNTPCAPGYGVIQEATQSSDTKCQPCPTGTFSDISSSVKPCHNFTRCENLGMVEKESGTSSSDVICETRKHIAIIVSAIVISGLVLVALLIIILRYRSWVKKKMQLQFPPHEQKAMMPEEIGPEEFELPHPAPVQETLSGQQPVVQEEGKDSRMPLQEIE